MKKTEDHFRITVRKIGSEAAHDPKHSGDVAVVALTILQPDGTPLRSFIARTGGFNQGALPGTHIDVDGDPNNTTHAIYDFQYAQAPAYEGALHKRYNYEQGTGFFMRLVSPDYVSRGVHRNNLEQWGAFGIHPDGVSGSATPNDGTMGCIGIQTDDAKAFAKAWNSIPESQRPTQLEVLPPRDLQQQINGYKSESSAQSLPISSLQRSQEEMLRQ